MGGYSSKLESLGARAIETTLPGRGSHNLVSGCLVLFHLCCASTTFALRRCNCGGYVNVAFVTCSIILYAFTVGSVPTSGCQSAGSGKRTIPDRRKPAVPSWICAATNAVTAAPAVLVYDQVNEAGEGTPNAACDDHSG